MSDSCWLDLRPYLYPCCECGLAWTTISAGRNGCRRCGINFSDPTQPGGDWDSNIVFPIRDYPMSRACGSCGHDLGRIVRKSGQDVVTCQLCKRYVYNASRAETGLPA